MEIIDLSLPVTGAPFREPSGYTDPPATVSPWITVGQELNGWTSPYQVSLLQLGAHAGTHIDAPSHFDPGGPTVSDLPTECLAGRAVVVDLRTEGIDQVAALERRRAEANQADVIPLILTPESWLSEAAVDEVIAWQRPLIVCAGTEDSDPSYVAVSKLLAAGRWLVSNPDLDQATRVRDGDLLVVAPLAWPGLEGAPCRILAVRL